MPPRILNPGDYRRAQWKNGLGHTDQIGIFPEGAALRRGDFLWRVSSARIDRSSDFSLFEHHDRFLVLLGGAGLRLTHRLEGDAVDETELPPFEVYEFPGDVPSRAELLDGPVTDLSVFVRRGEVQGAVEVLELSPDEEFECTLQGEWNFLFAARGSFTVGGDRVAEGGTYLLERPEAPRSLLLRGERADARAVLIQLGRPGV